MDGPGTLTLHIIDAVRVRGTCVQAKSDKPVFIRPSELQGQYYLRYIIICSLTMGIYPQRNQTEIAVSSTTPPKTPNSSVIVFRKPAPNITTSNMDSSNTTQDEDIVSRLINEGASLIEARQYEMAMSMLHKALSAQKGGVLRSRQYEQQQHGVQQNKRSRENIVLESHQEGQTRASQRCCSNTTTFDFLNLVPSSRFIYKRPIYVQGTLESDKCQSTQGIKSVAIVFNLALAHHMAGLDERMAKNSGVLLSKSLRLYALAQQLVLKLNQESDQDDTIMVDEEKTPFAELFNVVHLLGASNNIAQVHKLLGRHDVANRHFQKLLSSVVYLIHVKSNKDDVSEATVMRPLMEALFHSASHLVLKKYAADAA
jgi:hypothetical protein